MIYSMTGYGGAKGELDSIAVSAELKSVNNRFLDVSVRLPKSYLFAEEAVRSAVAAKVSRGKVDVFLSVDSSAADTVTIKVNQPLAEAYVSAVRGLSEQYGLPDELSALSLARFPEVLSTDREDADRDTVTRAIVTMLDRALDDYNAMRAREGERLCADLLDKLDRIEKMVEQVESRSPLTVAEYRQKLTDKMQEVLASAAVDEARILQEAAIYADRVAVDEETVRMRSHLAQFRQMLADGSPIGRKLDFLVQEMNREANTIGSKANDVAMAQTVVNIKSEIEKIREQIQNIE